MCMYGKLVFCPTYTSFLPCNLPPCTIKHELVSYLPKDSRKFIRWLLPATDMCSYRPSQPLE